MRSGLNKRVAKLGPRLRLYVVFIPRPCDHHSEDGWCVDELEVTTGPGPNQGQVRWSSTTYEYVDDHVHYGGKKPMTEGEAKRASIRMSQQLLAEQTGLLPRSFRVAPKQLVRVLAKR